MIEDAARRKLKCPRCGRVSWPSRDAGGVGTRCPSCGGVHLAPNDVEQVFSYELGLTPAELRERATQDDDDDLGDCSACAGPLSHVDVEGAGVELCLRCGAGWLDPGELEQLTHGRHLERAPPDEVARKHLPEAVVHQARKGRVRVPSVSRSQSVLGWTGLVLGIATSPYFIGAPLVAGSLYLLLKSQILVDFDRGLVRAKTGTTGARQGLALDAITSVGVAPRGYIAEGKPRVKWAVVCKLGDREEETLVTYRDRLLAHRVVFQLSQVLEVPVDVTRVAERAGEDPLPPPAPGPTA